MIARIIHTRSHGLEVFRAEVWRGHQRLRSAQFLSIGGARNWLAAAIRGMAA